MSTNSTFASAWDAHIAELQTQRRAVRDERDRQVAALYPHMRTFILKNADAVHTGDSARRDDVPRTMTLVTPTGSSAERDHLYVGPHPVLARNMHWDKAFEELSFATSDGALTIRGHLRLTHSRLRAFGMIDIGGNAYAVEYEVPPQRYTMKIAKNAAYLAGDNATITWDTQSERWTGAEWSTEPEVGFTYGVNGEEVIGDEKVYTFLASFDDIPTKRVWAPFPLSYSGFLTHDLRLAYALSGGTTVPGGPGSEHFPYTLAADLSEFAYDFAGGMVVGASGYSGTPYGVIGTWARIPAAGLYHLQGDGLTTLVGVHDGALYIGGHRVAGADLAGDTLAWHGLPKDLAQAAGLPHAGHLVFSRDGAEVTASSFGATGRRVSPDQALDIADALTAPQLRDALRRGRTLHADPEHDLAALTRMTQFAVDAKGMYYDVVQQGSMDDFYSILQHYMDQDLRRQFFNPAPPPPLDPQLQAIAKITGTKGTDPIPWYGSLSVPYTACALAQYSADPAAATINGKRAETALTAATSGSDVMAAQGPLLYQRRYQNKHENLDWFLADQKANAAKYAPAIDAKVEQWIAEAKAAPIGTPEELAALEKQLRDLGAYAKDHDQYWAFALYTFTTMPAYLNMLQTILLTGTGIDGSEFTQRVQRTVAVLNVLDTTSHFTQQYGYLLQLFQLGSILPQMYDFSNDLSGFSYAVKQILDKFIEQYINSPDPKMREAAEALQQHAKDDFIDRVLSILHTSAAVGHGIYEWAHVAARFENAFGRFFAHVPHVVGKMIAIAGGTAMMGFFLLGAADWNELEPAEQALVIAGGASVTAQILVPIVQRGMALGSIWESGAGLWKNLRKFWTMDVIDEALKNTTSSMRNWLMSNKGSATIDKTYTIKEAFKARSLFTAESNLPAGQRFKTAVFGRNIGQFLARVLGATFAIIGIVLSSIALAGENEPLELAANILFLTASCLELVAIVGGWAMAGSAVAVGGMLVTTIFAIVSIVGLIAMVAGVVLLIILMTRPQESPVEKFAKSSGTFYMPYKTAIEYFRVYEPLNRPQRAGVAVLPGGSADKALMIGSDGTVKQAKYDASGHTAFYISTDATGRVQIGAPVKDAKGAAALLALAVDDTGKVVARSASGSDASLDTHLLWYTEGVGEGTYEETASKTKELRSAPFKLYTALTEGSATRRYLAADDAGGWVLRDGDGTVVQLTMEVMAPAELTMGNVTWYTVEHDQRAEPALQVPGSLARTWTITPALPEGLEFLPATGTIAMKIGRDVPAAERKTYTVKVTNDVGGASTDFDLQVLVPAFEPTGV